MHRWLFYAAFGWLALSGTLHFAIDVVSQHIRGVRTPGPETTLYYGLNTAYALGQVVFGLLGLFVALKAPPLLGEPALVALCLAGAAGWLAITFRFMEYREPRFAVALFGLLIVAASVSMLVRPTG
jgi:hypothetical protein